jgi:dTDP-4-dehydrorhamnose reductase
MKRICLIGANGQLGNEIKSQGEAFATLNITSTDLAELDISKAENIQAFFESHHFDIVINCAAYTAVDLAETEKERNDLINNLAVKHLDEACRKQGALLIHISTDFVYDGTKCTPMVEEDPTNPLQEYGKSKLRGEQWVKDGIVIRTAWLYSTTGNNFVKTMMRLGAERAELNVVNNQVGTPTSAKDLAEAILVICQDEEAIRKKGLYLYSNEGVASWYDFAQSIMEYAELPCKVNPIPDSQYPTPAKRPAYSVLDKTKIKNTFKLEIPYWRKSLKECIIKLK